MATISVTIPEVTEYTVTPSRLSPTTFFVDRETRLSEEATRIPEQNTQATALNTFKTQANAVRDEVNGFKTAAETAQGLSEDARDASIVAQGLAEDAQVAAALSATQASNYAASYSATSTSSVLIGTGAKTFTIQAGKLFVAGQYLLISDNATPSNYMHGQVTSYSGTTLIMSIEDIGGSGTIALWDISISGTRGATGATGGGLANLVEDLTPQLGGDLDLNGHIITDVVLSDTSPQLGGVLDTNSKQVQLSKGADVASATALPILTDGNYFIVTGVVTITSIATTSHIGTTFKLEFDGILTLTHSANLFLNANGGNITTAVGDVAEFVEVSAGNFKCVNYDKADGTSLVSAVGGSMEFISEVITTDGLTSDITSIDGTYDEYIIEATGINPSNDATGLWMQIYEAGVVRTDNFYQYHISNNTNVSSAYGTPSRNNNGGNIAIHPSLTNNSAFPSSFTLKISGANIAGAVKNMTISGSITTNVTATMSSADGFCSYTNKTGVMTGVRVFASAGNINCKIKLYGIKKS